jgi:uncharacterized protein YaiE (UPF0345 family)
VQWSFPGRGLLPREYTGLAGQTDLVEGRWPEPVRPSRRTMAGADQTFIQGRWLRFRQTSCVCKHRMPTVLLYLLLLGHIPIVTRLLPLSAALKVAAHSKWLRTQGGYALNKVGAHSRWLRTQGACTLKVAAHSRWLRTQGGCALNVAAHSRCMRTQSGCAHKVVAHSRCMHTQGGCTLKVAAHSRWLRTKGGCALKVAAHSRWLRSQDACALTVAAH